VAFKVAREKKIKTERQARLAQLDDRDTSFEELQAVAKKEFADDKAAEERRIRGEHGMVRPVDADPDFKGDPIRSSDAAVADKISSRLQRKAFWNKVFMDHINVNTDWLFATPPTPSH
jgi:hypothetical protein